MGQRKKNTRQEVFFSLACLSASLACTSSGSIQLFKFLQHVPPTLVKLYNFEPLREEDGYSTHQTRNLIMSLPSNKAHFLALNTYFGHSLLSVKATDKTHHTP